MGEIISNRAGQITTTSKIASMGKSTTLINQLLAGSGGPPENNPPINPPVLHKPSPVVLALRLTIIFSIVAMTLTSYGYKWSDVPIQVYAAMGVFLLNTVFGRLRYFRLLDWATAEMTGFIIDIAAMTLFIYYSAGQDAQRFYLVFLIIVLITATIRSVISAFITTFIGALVYGLMSLSIPSGTGPSGILGTSAPAETLFSAYFLSRISFLFIVATFIGYLSEEVERHRREKTASEQLLATEIKDLTQYLKNVFQSVPGGIIVVDTSEKITVFNKRAEELFDLNAPGVLGQQIYNIPRLKEFYRAMTDFYSAPPAEKEQNPERARAEITLNRGIDAPLVYMGIRFSILRNATGKKTGTIGVFQDLTQIKQYEKELLQKERMAAVGQLASAMTHDFFNTLGGLNGIVDAAIKNPYPEQVAESLGIIKRSLGRALAIVRNLLNFSRKPEPQPEPVVLSGIINEALLMVKHDLDRDGIEVVKYIEDVPAIMSDPNLLSQVLLNLLLNARQAILPDKGKITVQLKNKWEFVEITVSDTGRGINGLDQAKIFDPFFTTKSAPPKQESGGMGLGLYVSREIIKALQGSIMVDSEPGRGATFIIDLPVQVR